MPQLAKFNLQANGLLFINWIFSANQKHTTNAIYEQMIFMNRISKWIVLKDSQATSLTFTERTLLMLIEITSDWLKY